MKMHLKTFLTNRLNETNDSGFNICFYSKVPTFYLFILRRIRSPWVSNQGSWVLKILSNSKIDQDQ